METGEIETVFIWMMENASLLRIPKNGAAASRISSGGAVWAATTLAGTIYWVESTATGAVVQSTPLQGGPVSSIRELSSHTVTEMGLVQGFTQIGVTDTTVFLGGEGFLPGVGSFSTYFPLVGPGPSLRPPAGGDGWTLLRRTCESFTSDADAVYCDPGDDANAAAIANDGTTTLLGTVNPLPGGSDLLPYVAFDDTYAYWFVDHSNPTNGTIMKTPKAGGGQATVVARATIPTAVAVDANSV